MKRCSKCGEMKPLDDFVKTKSTRDGRHTQCKACKHAADKAYRLKNRATILVKQRANRAADPDYMKRWRADNPTYFRDRERELAKDPEYRSARALRRAVHHRDLRTVVITHLGGCCADCGFTDPRALQIDHINGGGNKELSSIPRTEYMRKVLASPGGEYQLLCANCNWIKRWENDEHLCSARKSVL